LASNPLLHRSIAGSRVSAKATGKDDVTDDKDTGDDISTTSRSKVLGNRRVYAEPSTSTVPSSSSQPTVPPVSISSADTSAEMETLDPKIQPDGSVLDA
jgi:hypothetical protein